MRHRAGSKAWMDLEAYSLCQRVSHGCPPSSFSVLLYTPGDPVSPLNLIPLPCGFQVGFGQREAPADGRWVEREDRVFLPTLAQPWPLGSGRRCFFSQNDGPPLTHRQEHCLLSLPLRALSESSYLLVLGPGWGATSCRFESSTSPIPSKETHQISSVKPTEETCSSAGALTDLFSLSPNTFLTHSIANSSEHKPRTVPTPLLLLKHVECSCHQ